MQGLLSEIIYTLRVTYISIPKLVCLCFYSLYLRLLEDGASTLKYVWLFKIHVQILIFLGAFVSEFDCKSKARNK